MEREYEIAGIAHYPGDVRETEVIAGTDLRGRVLRAAMTDYDEEMDRTTTTFVVEDDPGWRLAVQAEEGAKGRMHLMWPAFFVGPESGGSDGSR